MKAIYRYRQERHFAKPPAAIWPFVSDTARIQELMGFAPFRFEERVDAQGRVRRYAHGKLGPFPVSWEENFGEWQENRRFFQVREYRNGPMRRWELGWSWSRNVAPRLDELAQICFARLECNIGQLAPKQFVSQPNAIGVDDIVLTVIGDVLNSPFPKIFLDLATVDTIGFAGVGGAACLSGGDGGRS